MLFKELDNELGIELEGIPGNTKADIVGENGGIEDIVMAVDGIDAINHGNAETSGQASSLEVINHGHPVLRGGS